MAIMQSIANTVDAYIRALYRSNGDTLRVPLAEGARLHSSNGQELIEISKPDYIEMVSSRASAEAAGHETWLRLRAMTGP